MIDVQGLAAFAVAAFVLIVIPGPSVLFVVSRGVALGRRAALLTVAGNSTGVYVQVMAVAFGVGAVVERSVAVFTVLRLAGAAYLVYLGVQAFRHRKGLATVLDAATVDGGSRRIYREGFLVGVTNPKMIVFLTAVLPQFVDPAGPPAAVQMLALGAILTAIAFASDSAWGLVAGTARSWLARKPRRLERLGGTGGLITIGLGLRLATTGRHD